MSSKLLKSLPYDDGFVMPAEYEPQSAVWMMLGGNQSHWHDGGFAIRRTQVEIARALNAGGTHVNIGAPQDLYLEAEYIFEGMDVSIYEISLNNCWPRDMGAITVKNRSSGQVRGVDFLFNGWGGEKGGAMAAWDLDNLAARKMLQYTGLDRYRAPVVFEGGSITVDGEGTVITTKSCLLAKNRNPDMEQEQIEKALKDYLGFTKVIWLDSGIDLADGETDGHVDDICEFIGPAEVVCCYTDDVSNEFYGTFKNAYEKLCSATDAKGRKLTVHKLPACRPYRYTKNEAENVIVSQGVGKNPDGKWRKEGDIAIPSYANFLLSNGSVIFPIYGLETDSEAVDCMKKIVGDRYVVRPVNAREIALCGGSIHCFTQQVSK